MLQCLDHVKGNYLCILPDWRFTNVHFVATIHSIWKNNQSEKL